MKNYTYILTLSAALVLLASCTKRWTDASVYHLDTLECLGAGKVSGTFQLGIWVYAANPAEAEKKAPTEIVKAICFGKTSIDGLGCPSKPIISDVTKSDGKTEKDLIACFETVMKNNPPSGFVSNVLFGQDRFRVASGKTKFKVYVTLDHNKLRKAIEDNGCIKKLGTYNQ